MPRVADVLFVIVATPVFCLLFLYLFALTEQPSHAQVRTSRHHVPYCWDREAGLSAMCRDTQINTYQGQDV